MTACSMKKDYYDRSGAVVDSAGDDTNDTLSHACIVIHMYLAAPIVVCSRGSMLRHT
jgi:hypothetical protein